ncbi:toll/interleukin-1 receptor domain-containing protein [Megalodesulfovibrio gigas]|uniref:TIR domain-containing protein n=2 Tax=Megalodesulfovibrio gigas TaxID=879 RepID=T2GE38_MEGG1|nr:toll/interleukin-1 receptor domain-containing protein [Megalodesulfovibrio gigas]AGW14157.1 hypothetical protein DGI_2408 [Megalodesulfovibrio gigas DSM 1382 = ATCC 19364]
MVFITEHDLRLAKTEHHKSFFVKKIYAHRRDPDTNIFLSHSHHDKDLALGIKYVLEKLDYTIYIDWLDSNLSPVTDITTAKALKQKVNESDLVLLLATNNALKSRWVPWEIGLADGLKSPDRIAIIPVADSTGVHTKNEYLQLYQSFEYNSKEELIVKSSIQTAKKSDGIILESSSKADILVKDFLKKRH